MTDQDYADFVKKYGEEAVLAGYEDFERFAGKRTKAFEDLKQEKIKQDINYSKFNKDFGTKRKYDYEAQLKHETQKLSTEEAEIAKKHRPKEIEKDKEELTKEEKLAEAKENGEEITTNSLYEDRSKTDEGKDKEVKKSWSVENKEKDAEIKFDYEEVKTEVTKKEEERAKLLAEMKAAQERFRQRDQEREL